MGEAFVTQGQADVARPRACPEAGTIPAFDAGWEAHQIGLGRATVQALTVGDAQGWALLGWDARDMSQHTERKG